MKCNFKSARKAAFVSPILILLGIFANPATANSFNFDNIGAIDLNQSRQFFNRGNRQIEREIEIFNESKEPIKLKLPEELNLPEDFSQPNSWYQQQKLKPTATNI